MPMNPTPAEQASPTGDLQPARRDWLRVLARARAADLARLAQPVLQDFRFEPLRAPEAGLVMVRARIGNSGDRFNLGEATVARCVVRHRAADGSVVAGVGHVLGTDTQHAERVACLDALLQRPACHALVMRSVVQPLADIDAQRCAAERAATETSRVRFYTLQPENA